MLDHVTERCRLSKPATISSKNGITSELYNLWIKAENAESLLFINPEEEEDGGGNRSRRLEKIMVPAMTQISKPSFLTECLKENLTGATKLVQNPENTSKEDISKEFLTALEMNPELAVLKLILDWQEMGVDLELQSAVIEQLKGPNFSNTALSKWATEIVQFIASANAQEREEDRFGLNC